MLVNDSLSLSALSARCSLFLYLSCIIKILAIFTLVLAISLFSVTFTPQLSAPPYHSCSVNSPEGKLSKFNALHNETWFEHGQEQERLLFFFFFHSFRCRTITTSWRTSGMTDWTLDSVGAGGLGGLMQTGNA